jgi:hypothetical protein
MYKSSLRCEKLSIPMYYKEIKFFYSTSFMIFQDVIKNFGFKEVLGCPFELNKLVNGDLYLVVEVC